MPEARIVFWAWSQKPRSGIKSGSIEGSKSLPLLKLVNTKNNTFFNKKKLKHIFSLKKANNNEIVMSCGSSVSASSLALAYSMINDDYMQQNIHW